MKKLSACLSVMLMATGALLAQDSTRAASGISISDTTIKLQDTVQHHSDSTHPASVTVRQKGDTLNQAADSTHQPADTIQPKQNDIKIVTDKNAPKEVGTSKDYDTRWFISPLFKFQLQDFGMLEKNHFGYLSNANELPILDRSNISASLSAYKNINSRFSASADIGLAYGHVTSTDVLVATTTPKTYNLVNVTAFYHLLGSQYKLQPFISVGINDLINDASYLTAPIGIGVKFHSRKIMILGQAAYGYGISKNIANTVMYNLCMYVPVNFKKKKQDADELSPSGDINGKDLTKNSKNSKHIKDSSSKTNGIVNNINITINMDSVLSAQQEKNGKKKNGTRDDDADRSDDLASGDNDNNDKKGLKAFNYDDFSVDDFEVDTIDGKAFVKFVVYFEFNQYDLNSSAFNRIDKVITRLRHDKNLLVDIKGYTDNVGTNEFNLFLSKKRAQIVFDYMNSRGIPSDRMMARFYGKENPVADNSNPNTAWLNRRVEILVHEKGTKVPNVMIPTAKYLRK